MSEKIVVTDFGCTKDGSTAKLFRIPNNTNDFVEISSYGCRLKSINIHNQAGEVHNVLLGQETLADYETSASIVGALGIGSCEMAHKVWNVAEIGENYVFLSCEASEKESGIGCKATVGARIMWVNLNRLVLDLYVTPEKAANVNFNTNCAFRFLGSEKPAAYQIRTFCQKVCVDGKTTDTNNSNYAQMAFQPFSAAVFIDERDAIKPMVELVSQNAGMTISSYSTLSAMTVSSGEAGLGAGLNASMVSGVSLQPGESFSARTIYGFDRLYTSEEIENPGPSFFPPFVCNPLFLC